MVLLGAGHASLQSESPRHLDRRHCRGMACRQSNGGWWLWTQAALVSFGFGAYAIPPGTKLQRLQQGFTVGGMGSDRHIAQQQSSGPNVRFGYKRTFRSFRPMSALPPKADIAPCNCEYTP